MDAKIDKQLRDFQEARVPGAIAVYLYQMDADPSEYYMAVVWHDKESYLANAVSHEQHARYQDYREALAGEPEWHDGEIVSVSIGGAARTVV
jgi:heme-degrading monooxygenase HmoA